MGEKINYKNAELESLPDNCNSSKITTSIIDYIFTLTCCLDVISLGS